MGIRSEKLGIFMQNTKFRSRSENGFPRLLRRLRKTRLSKRNVIANGGGLYLFFCGEEDLAEKRGCFFVADALLENIG